MHLPLPPTILLTTAAPIPPLLLLLHGHGDAYDSWVNPEQGDLLDVAKGLRALVVMPEADHGWYTNWWNGGARGDPAWESYHLDEVIPHYPVKRSAVLPLLHLIQEDAGYISAEATEWVAARKAPPPLASPGITKWRRSDIELWIECGCSMPAFS